LGNVATLWWKSFHNIGFINNKNTDNLVAGPGVIADFLQLVNSEREGLFY
jgi:hypothetical protein